MLKITTNTLIWHYTTVNVLNEFLKEESYFYGTHYKFLNDGKEIEYGREIFSNCVRQFPYVKQYADQLLQEDNSRSSDVYVFCFSHKKDDLYQWRSYATDGGFAIGFNLCEIDRSVQEFKKKYEPKIPFTGRIPKPFEDIKMNFISCDYDEKYIMDRISNDIEIFIKPLVVPPGIDQLSLKERAKAEKSIHDSNIMAIKHLRDQYIWIFKHPTFSCEEEKRIGIYGWPLREKIQLIGGKPRIPLFEINRASISEIMVSPHGNVQRNKMLAELLRDRYKLNYKITVSNSSYCG